MSEYKDTKLMLMLKYGSMKLAYYAWRAANIIDIKVEHYSTAKVFEYIRDAAAPDVNLDESDIKYIRREGWSDIETKIICDWHDERLQS